MIVIFVPSPPHPPPRWAAADSSPPSTPRPPSAVCMRHRHSYTRSAARGPACLSFLLFLRWRRDRRTQEFLLVPFTLFFLLVPLIVARERKSLSFNSYVPPDVSLSLALPLTRSFLPRPSRSFLSIYPKAFRVVPYLRRLSTRAEEDSSFLLTVARVLCIYIVYTRSDNNRNFRWRWCTKRSARRYKRAKRIDRERLNRPRESRYNRFLKMPRTFLFDAGTAELCN